MPDPNAEIPLEAGGQRYTLYVGNRALRLFEREAGRTLEAAVQSMGIQEMTLMVWAALQQHHAGLTIEDVDDIIDAAGYSVVLDALQQAYNAAMPRVSQDVGKNPPVAGTGRPSSRRHS